MKSAMGDALKGKLGSLKGPAQEMPMGHPMMGGDAGAVGPDVGYATGGDSIDLSKVDPALIQAIIKKLTESNVVEGVESPEEQAQEEKSGGLEMHSKEEKEDETDQAPSRKAVSAIADGGVGHEAGSLRARAAAGAKQRMAQMKDKGN